jgi:hypothetical protein
MVSGSPTILLRNDISVEAPRLRLSTAFSSFSNASFFSLTQYAFSRAPANSESGQRCSYAITANGRRLVSAAVLSVVVTFSESG